VLVGLVYGQAGWFDFVNYDDSGYVSENMYVQTGFTLDGIAWAFTSSYTSNWHPLTWLSLMLDTEIWGTGPGGYHVTNVLLHAINAVLMLLVLKRMTGSLWKSGLVAALFALHPLHVESVAWISERKDVLSGMFWLLTMWAYVVYVDSEKKRWYLLTLCLLVAGLMAKPMLVSLPLVLLLLDYWPLGRYESDRATKTSLWLTARRLTAEKIPLLIVTGGFCVVAFLTQQARGGMMPAYAFTLPERIGNGLLSYAKYAGKMIWPEHLAMMYPHPGKDYSVPGAVLAAAAISGISLLVIRVARKRGYLAAGWLWYLITLVPVIGLVQIGTQAMADRYTYIPLTGLFIAIVWASAELSMKWRHGKSILATIAILVIGALSVRTYYQTRHWRDSIALFENALAVTENNYVAHYLIAETLRKQGKMDQAIAHCRESQRIKPYCREAYYELGMCFQQKKEYDKAIEQFDKAVRMQPDYIRAHYRLAMVLGKTKQLERAAVHFARTLELNPDHSAAHYYLGNILLSQGDLNPAEEHLEKALPDNLTNAKLYHNLGQACLQQGKFSKAIELAQRACELTEYNNLRVMGTLAEAYGAAGMFTEAIATARKIVEQAQLSGEKQLAREFQSRLVFFQSQENSD